MKFAWLVVLPLAILGCRKGPPATVSLVSELYTFYSHCSKPEVASEDGITVLMYDVDLDFVAAQAQMAPLFPGPGWVADGVSTTDDGTRLTVWGNDNRDVALALIELPASSSSPTRRCAIVQTEIDRKEVFRSITRKQFWRAFI